MFGFQRPTRADRRGGAAFNPDVPEILRDARRHAVRVGSSRIDSEHILLALLDAEDPGPSRLLAALGVRIPSLRTELEQVLAADAGAGPRGHVGPTQDVPFTKQAKRAIEAALAEATGLGQATFNPTHLLLGVLAEPSSRVGKLLAGHGARLQAARDLARAGPAPTVALAIRIDDQSDRLIYQQIVAQVQEAIATGRLLPGERLPPIRQLADELEIAPGTVARAYSELEAAGIVTTDRARGTFVARTGAASPAARRAEAVRDLLRPAVVAAFHLGASATEVRTALEQAMLDIYPDAA